jgi:hypothetical protein
MNKRLIIYILTGFVLTILLGLFALRHLHTERITDETKTVYIKKSDNGFQLIRNGKPFYIQGAGGNSHFEELASIGGNTIRLYDTINLGNFLNEAQKSNLAVIVDIPILQYNKKYDFYLNEDSNRILKQKIKALVNKFKNHPALLIWNLGNELFYPFVFRKNCFIRTFNELIEIIHVEDPDHPVSTALAGVSRKERTSIYIHSPEIDLLSFNTFGDIENSYHKINHLPFIFGALPYYFSEIGSDGMWEAEYTLWGAQIEQTSAKKAEQIRTRYNFLVGKGDRSCLGSLFFYWGYKHELTYSWFSLFKDDYKSEIIKDIESLWKKTITIPSQIGLEYMLVDGKGAHDNIIFAPNELKTSEIKFNGIINDSVRIKWEIYPEKWHNDTSSLILNPRKIIDSFKSFEKNRAIFITPGEEGPYRIFAWVYDQNGYFAATNTPFYVLNNK